MMIKVTIYITTTVALNKGVLGVSDSPTNTLISTFYFFYKKK